MRPKESKRFLGVVILLGIAKYGCSTHELANAADFAVLCQLVKHAESGFAAQNLPKKPDAQELAKETIKLAILNDANETRYKSEKTRAFYGIKPEDARFGNKAGVKHIREKLLAMADNAEQLQKDIDGNSTQANNKIKQVNNELAEAVFGSGAKFPWPTDLKTLFTGGRASALFGNAATIAKNCGGKVGGGDSKSASNVGITLASDIYCLCFLGAGSDEKHCDKTQTAQATGNELTTLTAATLPAKFEALLKGCGSKPKETECNAGGLRVLNKPV
uniref:Variant surface glycoprotein 1841 n=1 Tax=Trypanosoma brucei TaxID=5691 RepID=M4SXH3_9TRYP|nr:variant surface glycoprotein 1841 [Trypanosoma brucei]